MILFILFRSRCDQRNSSIKCLSMCYANSSYKRCKLKKSVIECCICNFDPVNHYHECDFWNNQTKTEQIYLVSNTIFNFILEWPNIWCSAITNTNLYFMETNKLVLKSSLGHFPWNFLYVCQVTYLISIDRYINVVHKKYYKRVVTNKSLAIAIILVILI